MLIPSNSIDLYIEYNASCLQAMNCLEILIIVIIDVLLIITNLIT